MAEKRDLVIIGGGPGGYLAAMRAAQLKKSVTLIEQDRIGGTCINYGCIPTKYLLHQTKVLKEIGGTKTLEGPVGEVRLSWAKVQQGRQAVVDQLVKGLVFLLEKGKVEIVKGTARLRPARPVVVRTAEGERVFAADKVIVATGTEAASLPFLRPDGRTVITSTEALTLAEVPKSLLVVGAGAIGLEMGSIYRRLGTEVTVLEILPQILPGSDKEAVTRLERALKKQGLKIHTEMRIDQAVVADGAVTLKGIGLKTGAPFEFRAEKALLSAGRKPNTSDLFDGGPFLDLDRGFIKVDAALRTSVPGIYAIGDVIGGKLLAHKAYHDAVVAVENASGIEPDRRLCGPSGGRLHRARIRLGRTDPGRGRGQGHQGQVGRLPAPGERPGHDHGRDGRPGQGPGRRDGQGHRRPCRRARRIGHDPRPDHGRGQGPDAQGAGQHHLYPPDAVRGDRRGRPQSQRRGAAYS